MTYIWSVLLLLVLLVIFLDPALCEVYRFAVNEQIDIVKPIRIGVCITGQIGRLELGSKRRHIFAPLKNNSMVTLDAVFILGNESKSVFVNGKTDENQKKYVNEEQITKFLQPHVDEVHVHWVEQPEDPIINPMYADNLGKMIKSNTKEFQLTRTKSHIRQWHNLRACYNAFVDMEFEHKERYDAFIRLRDDGFFVDRVNPFPVVPSKTQEVGSGSDSEYDQENDGISSNNSNSNSRSSSGTTAKGKHGKKGRIYRDSTGKRLVDMEGVGDPHPDIILSSCDSWWGYNDKGVMVGRSAAQAYFNGFMDVFYLHYGKLKHGNIPLSEYDMHNRRKYPHMELDPEIYTKAVLTHYNLTVMQSAKNFPLIPSRSVGGSNADSTNEKSIAGRCFRIFTSQPFSYPCYIKHIPQRADLIKKYRCNYSK